MKNLSILGSTGSIGTQTLDIVKNNAKEFKIIGLTTNKNIELLKKQIIDFKPEAVAVMDKEKADLLEEDCDITVYSSLEGIIKIATLNNIDTVVNSLVGSIGVKPTLEAIENRKNIALANKETLVTAGKIVMEEVRRNKVSLMPIDSEHSAVSQCLNKEIYRNTINKIIITASGGPFRNYSKKQLENVTVQDSLKHPTWNMGNKITIDSATLMNKGLEVIEAHWLYGIDYKNIEVVIHPQSIVHSLVEFKDNSILAQLSLPDMRIPIQYALSYPKRFPLKTKRLDLLEVKNLSFEKPNIKLFPCLKYACEAGIIGGTMPAVLNAANEVAVNAFLNNKIKFLDIPELINMMIERRNIIKNPGLSQILDADKKAREGAKKLLNDNLFPTI